MKKPESEIVSLIRVSACPDKRREFFLTISSLLDSMRNEEGCRDYKFYGEAGDQDSFVLIGEWNTAADWYHHAKSDQFVILRGSLELLSQQKHLDLTLLSRINRIESFPGTGATNKGA